MKNAFLVITLLLAFGGACISAQNNQLFFDEADALFGKYVVNGAVDYTAIKKDPRALNSVLRLAEEAVVSPSERKEYQAFWINAYNIFVIKGVIDNYPIKSPLEVEGFFKQKKYRASGESLTLDQIENRKLRAVFDEARIHFVLVCGAKGCPPIIGKAYTPGNLNSLLQQQTIKALNNRDFIRVDGNKVELSEIFKWYEEDFTKSGTVLEYINLFRKEKIPLNSNVSYYQYDWRLNSK